MNYRTIIALSIVLFLSTYSYAQLLHMNNGNQCVFESDWSIRGIQVGDTVQRVDSLLGKPLIENQVTEEDDGDEYINYKRKYQGFEVDIVRGFVDRISITSSQVKFKCGVTIGQKYVKLISLFGQKPIEVPDRSGVVEFPACHYDPNADGKLTWSDISLLITLSPSYEITKIEIEAIRP